MKITWCCFQGGFLGRKQNIQLSNKLSNKTEYAEAEEEEANMWKSHLQSIGPRIS